MGLLVALGLILLLFGVFTVLKVLIVIGLIVLILGVVLAVVPVGPTRTRRGFW